MPKYFFNVDGPTPSKDDEGFELTDLDAVRAQATKTARELVAESIFPGDAANLAPSRVFVTDESGREVLTIQAKDVLPEHLRG